MIFQDQARNTRLTLQEFLREGGLNDNDINSFITQRYRNPRKGFLNRTDILALRAFLEEGGLKDEEINSYINQNYGNQKYFRDGRDIFILTGFLKEGGLSDQEIDEYIAQNYRQSAPTRSLNNINQAELSKIRRFLREGGLGDQEIEEYIAQNYRQSTPTQHLNNNNLAELSKIRRFLREGGLSPEVIEEYVATHYQHHSWEKSLEEEKESNRTRVQSEEQAHPCKICLDKISPDTTFKFKNCKHVFHRDCVEDYIVDRIKDRAFPIICPIVECRREMAASDIKEAIQKIKYKQLFDEYTLKFFLDSHSNEYAYCLTPNCDYAVCLNGQNCRFDCPKCQKSYCFGCKTGWHNELNCQQFKDQQKNDNLFFDLAREAKYQKCPQCNFYIEKNQGCNNMTCRRCNTQFCYGCGVRLGESCKCR